MAQVRIRCLHKYIRVMLFMTVMEAVLGMSPSLIPYPDLGMGYHHGDVITYPNPIAQSYQRLVYGVNKTDAWQSWQNGIMSRQGRLVFVLLGKKPHSSDLFSPANAHIILAM